MAVLKNKVLVVAGARPNFMKVAPILAALRASSAFRPFFVHTGQHYDYHMSEVFFQELRLPKPDVHLNVGSGSHAVQTARIMEAFERIVAAEKPRALIVVGDVNSTLACTLVAAKMGVLVAHVEAGLRSGDRRMPEEINRLATDSISDLLFASEPSGVDHLKREGIGRKKIFHVGNVMIDSLISSLPQIGRSEVLRRNRLVPGGYAVATLHRPSNVDGRKALAKAAHILETAARRIPVVYPIHPRTKQTVLLAGFGARFVGMKNLRMIEPQGYIDFIRLVKDSKFVLTDSGGLQEETTYLKVPCLTMRENTERPVTVLRGTNRLVGVDRGLIRRSVDTILAGKWKKGSVPQFWDGKAAARIVSILKKTLR
jgi:UDP-N-acetylglucosamine 2-epimerase (non-hydrolysing)